MTETTEFYSTTLLNSTGDITLTWEDGEDAEIKKMIQDKIPSLESAFEEILGIRFCVNVELISDSQIQDNKIYISDELIDTFDKYWKRLNPDTFKGGLALPFFHLKNDGFWKLKFSDIYSGGRPQTIPKIRADVDYAILDEELYKLLQEPEARRQLIDTLIEAWFSSSQKQLEDILEINQVLQQDAF